MTFLSHCRIGFFNYFRSLGVFLLILSIFILAGCGGGGAASTGGGNTGSGGGGGTGQGGSGGGAAPGPFAAGRTKYVRTDATTEYFGWINSHWALYHAATGHFFVTDPSSNHVIVLDAATETEIGTISVPGAFSVDDTPDHSTLYVATLIGDVYAIDPVNMSVTHRYVGSQIGPSGYFAFSALVMQDGRLALLGEPGGFASVDGSQSFALWNPLDNSFSLNMAGLGSGPQGSCGSFMGNIGGFSRTVDRQKIILASIDSDSTLCEIDETSGQGISVSTGASFTMDNFRTTPDGKYIIVPGNPGGANIYDAQTLQRIGQFTVNGETATDSGFFLSPDSTTLYTPNNSIIYAYSLPNGQQTGWLPNIYVPPTSSGGASGPIGGPNVQATDGSGLFIGPLEQGVAFVDTKILRTGSLGTQFLNGYLSPATGSTSGGTPVQMPYPGTLLGSLSAVYFNSNPATEAIGSSGLISSTTPSGNPGPADVYTFTTDGGFQLLPEGFSYGPTILEVSPNMATAEGGGTGYIFGYGFGPISAASTTPQGLQVTVGGKPAVVTGLFSSTGAVPFQLQAISYTIPSGAGNSDVAVTAASGAATAHAAMTYLPGVSQFSLQGASLVQGIYDPHQDLYYFTDVHEIRVFSKTLGNWLSPITIPAPNGSSQSLWGIALSPDGTQLAVSDAAAGVIYVLNPVNPASIKTFVVNTGNVGIEFPAGLAISNSGTVYYTVFWQGVDGESGFYKLDTNTGTITNYHIDGPGLGTNDALLRASISPDGSQVYFNNDGYVFAIDTATDKVLSASTDPGCCYGDDDLSLSADGSRLAATSYFYDGNLNAQSYFSQNDREIAAAQYVYGMKLSADGTLLYQPSVSGIDVFDARLGNLLQRISLPFSLSEGFDALVADGKENTLIAITGVNGDGIAIVDLTSIAELAPLPYASRQSLLSHRLVRWGRSGPELKSQALTAKHSLIRLGPKFIQRIAESNRLEAK